MNFHIKTYTSSKLHDFINSEDFKHLENYPITPHRALSHINNPRVDKEDKLLYIAYENNKIVGYRLILADSIKVDNNSEKIGWYSCVWVHPQKRGSGIAKKLVEISLKDWNEKIIFQGPVTASKNLYTSSQLFNEVFIEGLRAYSRFDLNHVISMKKPNLKTFSPFFKLVDGFLNLIVDGFSNKIKEPESIKIITQIDDEVDDFIKTQQEHNLFKRNKEDFNWILNYPWILSSDTIDPISANYHFSSITKDFRFICAKFYNHENKLSGFVIYQIRNKHLSIHTAYFDSVQIKNIIDYTYFLIKKNKINFFSVYNKQLTDYIIENKNPFIFKKHLKRGFYYSKKLDHYFKKNPQLRFEAGDGDMIFT